MLEDFVDAMGFGGLVLLLVAAWLWYETTLRFVAGVEGMTKRRVSGAHVLAIVVFWPLMIVLSVIKHISNLPRYWDPDLDDPPKDDE